MPRANWDFIGNLPVINPPLPEQQAIARFLDEKTEQIDALIAKKERLLQLLAEKRTALITRAVTKGLDPDAPMKDSGIPWLGVIPANWEVTKLKYITEKIGDGIHATPQYDDTSDIYFINGNNLNDGKITITSNTRAVDQSEYEKYMINIKEGSILMSLNGTIGKIAFYEGERVVLGKSAAYIIFSVEINREYIFYLLQSLYVKKYFEASFSGTTINNLSLNTLRNTPILIPSLDEQNIVVSDLSEKLKDNKSAIVQTAKQVNLLKEYRASLITHAVTGKIDVREYDHQTAVL
jgi:type I restriction enzyme S subunit